MSNQVEIQVELEELEDQEDSADQGGVFELDPFDVIVGQNGDDSDSDDGEEDGDNLSDISSEAADTYEEDEAVDLPSNVQHIQDMVKKLDVILKLVFDYFHRTHITPTTSLDSDSPLLSPLPTSNQFPDGSSPRPVSPSSVDRRNSLRRSQFHCLLSIFDRTIICTFKSRYTQFLVFWYSSLDPEFADLFQGLLVSKALLEQDQPPVTRAAAASYIGSFVSRAQFIDRDGARRVMGVLCNFLRSHIDAFDGVLQNGGTVPNMAHHSVFYAIAQAVFLIFCFRWRDLLEDQDEEELPGSSLKVQRKWMTELNVVQRVVTSPLNPLKVPCYHAPSYGKRSNALF
jgi:RNA polymerase I-specific transcription initiation factor RRN3